MRMTKLIVMIVTIIQISGTVIPGLFFDAAADAFRGADEPSVLKAGDLPSVLLAVRSGLREQVRMVMELPGNVSLLITKTNPPPERRKKRNSRSWALCFL